MNKPFDLPDGSRLYPPDAHLIDDGCPPREAAQWSLQDSDGRARPLSLDDAVEVALEVDERLRLDLIRAHIGSVKQAIDLTGVRLGQLETDVDGLADELMITLVKLGQFVEQATHDLSRSPAGAELV